MMGSKPSSSPPPPQPKPFLCPTDYASFSDWQLKNTLKTQGVDTVYTDRDSLIAAVRSLPPQRNLSLIRREIQGLLQDRNHDDGSYVPLLIRFAWHNSGTYDHTTNTGGCNGGTMRFQAEQNDPENAGLKKAIHLLEPLHDKYPFLSHSDIWILAGYVAIESSGGPYIQFATGRLEMTDVEAEEKYGPSKCPFGDGLANNPSGSRLPAADLGPITSPPPGCPYHKKEFGPTIDATRGVFTRLGLSDKETVCLILLGHQYGRGHLENSGYEHPWYTFDPTHWSAYEGGLGYLSLYSNGVAPGRMSSRVTSKGKRQFEFHFGGGEPFMMLPVDVALWHDESYQAHVKYYDRNRRSFKKDSGVAFKKLTELGCSNLVAEV